MSVYSGSQEIFFYNRFESNAIRHYDIPIDVNEEGIVMIYLNSTYACGIVS